jgi:DNA-binding response OmpR family regulator
MSDAKKRKILVIEDEKDIAKLLKYNLEKEGHEVAVALDGAAGISHFRKDKPDLVILDLMLPRMSGLEVCRSIRQEDSTPIIMLTAKREEADRIVGLELGADDYVTKPFSVRELMARVGAVFRRLEPARPGESGAARVGSLQMNFEKYEVRVGSKEVALSPKEFEFLKLLVQARGRVLSRDRLLETVWGADQSMEIDTRTVDQHVARLRRKLGVEGERIVTVKNAGYKVKWD